MQHLSLAFALSLVVVHAAPAQQLPTTAAENEQRLTLAQVFVTPTVLRILMTMQRAKPARPASQTNPLVYP